MSEEKLIYSGKAKSLYRRDNNDYLIMEFRDDMTAYNAKKQASFVHKGITNNHINAFIMETLKSAGIPVHFEKLMSENTCLVKHLSMIPVECVIRNLVAGSLCKRLGLTEGETLSPPVFEFYFKNDPLNDPLINESHIITFQWATQEEIEEMQSLTLKINEILEPVFAKANMILVDFKLEFGRYQGKLYLGDEFTPDGCRLWDASTFTKLDKDRFRLDMGNIIESYVEVAKRLGVTFP